MWIIICGQQLLQIQKKLIWKKIFFQNIFQNIRLAPINNSDNNLNWKLGLFNAIIGCNTMVCIWPIPVVLCVISHLSFLPIQGKTVLHNPKCLQNHYYGWMISWCSTQSRGFYFQKFISPLFPGFPGGHDHKLPFSTFQGCFWKWGFSLVNQWKVGVEGFLKIKI